MVSKNLTYFMKNKTKIGKKHITYYDFALKGNDIKVISYRVGKSKSPNNIYGELFLITWQMISNASNGADFVG